MKWRWAVKIHKQQIVPTVAVKIGNGHGVRRAGTGNFHRLGQRVIGLLREKINRAVVAE